MATNRDRGESTIISQMHAETLEVPERVQALLQGRASEKAQVVEALRARPPKLAVSFARGSSDHAATLAHQLWKTRYGVWSFSCPPSQFMEGQQRLDLTQILAFAISQSGQSTDLCECVALARSGGAFTLAFVNEPVAPLREYSEQVWSLEAGPEHSVAATKSFICSLTALLDFASLWQGDVSLRSDLQALPKYLELALHLDWTSTLKTLTSAQSILLVGRGAMMSALDEAALKFKETCALHAEAISAAELWHGPLALLGPSFPVWVVAPPGPHQAGLIELAIKLRRMDCDVTLFAANSSASSNLPLLSTGNEYLDPLAWTVAFYLYVEALARARAMNPDVPRHLRKVTITK